MVGLKEILDAKELESIEDYLATFEKRENIWIFLVKMHGDIKSFPVIGLDSCVFTCFRHEDPNNEFYFFAVVEAVSQEEAREIGRRKLLAASGSFAYANNLSYLSYPTSETFEIYVVESVDSFLESSSLITNKKYSYSLLFQSLKSSEMDAGYNKRITSIYESLFVDDPYTLQAAEYLLRALYVEEHSPSEAITIYFKLFELLICKLDGTFQRNGSISDQTVQRVIDATAFHQDIYDQLIKFRNIRNNLSGHGVIEPEVQILLSQYVPTKDWERDFIDKYGSVELGLIQYRIAANILGRKIFSEIVGVPFFLIDYPGCNSQLDDRAMLESNALEPLESSQPFYEGVTCGAGYGW